MKNPLSSKYSEKENLLLVEQSLAGDSKALSQLVELHQPFIYNVAWKMTHDPNDAMDLMQETLIKVITKLGQFKFKSSFRTWLYRIVVNEFLQSKKRKGAERFTSFEDYGKQLDAIPNPDLTEEEAIELRETSREMQFSCMSGMLMCLTKEQRLLYILGESFGIDHNVGAEIFEITPQNFRVKLHRARKELYNYMNNKCGLVNKKNPCRCPKKAKALKKMGLLDEKNVQFNVSYKNKIADYVEANLDEATRVVEDKYVALFREHPTKEDFVKGKIVSEILGKNDLMHFFELN